MCSHFRGFMEFRINHLFHYWDHFCLHLPVSSTFYSPCTTCCGVLHPHEKGRSQLIPSLLSTNSYLPSLSFQNVKGQSMYFFLSKGEKTYKGKKKLSKYTRNCKYQIYFYKARLKILTRTILWNQQPHFKNEITTKTYLRKQNAILPNHLSFQ